MILEVRAVPPFYKNGFVVGCERTREAIVIDPGDEIDELLAAVRDRDAVVQHILLTHAHLDHISGVDTAKNALDAPVYLHRDDLPLYEHVVEQGAMFGFKVRPQPPVDVFYDMAPILLRRLRGHASITRRDIVPAASASRSGRKGEAGTHLFVGDTLFAGSIGRTDLPGGNFDVLMKSITGVLFPLGDEAVVHPGHGPDTTIGRERATNPFVVEYLAGS